MAYREFRIHKLLLIYVPPFLLVFGTVGNVLSFCVLIRKSLRQTSAYNLLAALSLADMLVLYVGLLRRWVGELTGIDIRDMAHWTCKVISMLGYTVSMYSVWLLIAVTVERFIVTVHGLRALTMCSTSRAIKTSLLILLVVVSINLHFLFTTELRTYEMDDGDSVLTCSSAYGYEYLVEHVWTWIDATLYCFLPFVLILILNGLIVHEVIRARKRRQQFLEHHIISSNAPPSVLSESSIRLTVMLLSVTFTFLLCTFPMMATMTYRAYSGPNEESLLEVSRFALARTISELLMYTNHSINFYLYLLTGLRFRQELKAMFTDCTTRQSSNNENNNRPSFTTTICKRNGSRSPELIPLNAKHGLPSKW